MAGNGSIKEIIEALIFAADKPVSARSIKSCIGELNGVNVREVVDQLNREYRGEGRAFFIMKIAGGYQMVTRPEFENWVKKLYTHKIRHRLSQAALETLAIIAYKQPITRSGIEIVRGVNCDGVLKTLLERDLILIKGREKSPGRPLLYATSKEFLRYFGLNSLSDLPRPKEIRELMGG